MPSAMRATNDPPPDDREPGGDADASSHDGGPVLVSLTSQRLQDRQRTLAEKKKKDDEQLAVEKKKEEEQIAIKEQQRALARDAAQEENEGTSNNGADPVDETAATSGAMEAGRRRGRNKDEEEDEEEKERATKQHGVGSPMRTTTGSIRKGPPESPLRVDDVDMSLDGNEGSGGGQPPGGSILRNRRVTNNQTKVGGSGSGAATSASKSKVGGSVNTTSSNRSRVRAKGSKKQTKLGWGRNTTQTFVGGDDDSEVVDVTPRGAGGGNGNPTPDEAHGTGKRTKRSLAGSTAKAAATRKKHVFSAYVVMTIEIGTGTDRADVPGAWEDIALAVLEKCHGFDASCCYIPPESKDDGKLIYWKADKPKDFSDWDDYMAWDDRDKLMKAPQRDRRAKIVSHCLLGMSTDPTEFIAKHNVDINRVKVGDSRVSVEMKHFQAWKTARRLMMVNGPTKCLMEEYQKYGTLVLSKLRKELVAKDPSRYPPSIYGEDPKLMVVLDWGRGGNWSDPKNRVAGENTFNRKVPTFLYEHKQEEMIMTLAKISKERKLEQEFFGQSAHWQELPSTKPSATPQSKKNDLDLMYVYQGGAQESLGSTVLEGLIRPDYKVPVELEYDAITNEPRPSPGEYSVMELLTRIYIGRVRLFQAILMGNDGHYLAFFSNINELSVSMASDIGRDVGAWLKIYLLKQGWKMSSVQQLIKKSFSPEAADSASRARLDKKTGRILSGSDISRMEANRAMDEMGIINRMLGYTESELAAMKAEEDRLMGGNKTEMPVLTASSFSQFQFGDEMSLQTLSPGRTPAGVKSVRGDDTYKLGAESQYSIRTDESTGFADFSDEEMEDEEKDVQIEMPEGGLEGMDSGTAKETKDTEMEDENGSEGSKLVPANIFGGGNLRPFREVQKEYSDRRKWTEEEYESWLRNVEEHDLAKEWQGTIEKKMLKKIEDEMVRRGATENVQEAISALAGTACSDSEEGLGKTLQETLRVSGGSKAEQARILREMLANLENDGGEKEKEDEVMGEEEDSAPPSATDGASGDVVNDVETGIPGSNADKTQDLDSEFCAQHFDGNGRDGDEAEQSTNNEYSPGDGPSDPG